MLLRFHEMTSAEDVYSELQQQTQLLEFDYYALCVRHPVPFTRPKISLHTTYPDAWVSQYQAENYFAIDPVLKPENFIQGHLPRVMRYSVTRRPCGMPPVLTGYAKGHAVSDVTEPRVRFSLGFAVEFA